MIIGPGGGELSTPVVVSFSGSFRISLSYLYAFWTLGQDRLTALCLPPQFAHFKGLCWQGFLLLHTRYLWSFLKWLSPQIKQTGGFSHSPWWFTQQYLGHTSFILLWYILTICLLPLK